MPTVSLCTIPPLNCRPSLWGKRVYVLVCVAVSFLDSPYLKNLEVIQIQELFDCGCVFISLLIPKVIPYVFIV